MIQYQGIGCPFTVREEGRVDVLASRLRWNPCCDRTHTWPSYSCRRVQRGRQRKAWTQLCGCDWRQTDCNLTDTSSPTARSAAVSSPLYRKMLHLLLRTNEKREEANRRHWARYGPTKRASSKIVSNKYKQTFINGLLPPEKTCKFTVSVGGLLMHFL